MYCTVLYCTEHNQRTCSCIYNISVRLADICEYSVQYHTRAAPVRYLLHEVPILEPTTEAHDGESGRKYKHNNGVRDPITGPRWRARAKSISSD